MEAQRNGPTDAGAAGPEINVSARGIRPGTSAPRHVKSRIPLTESAASALAAVGHRSGFGDAGEAGPKIL